MCIMSEGHLFTWIFNNEIEIILNRFYGKKYQW